MNFFWHIKSYFSYLYFSCNPINWNYFDLESDERNRCFFLQCSQKAHTDRSVFMNLWCFLQDLLGGRPLRQDREFGPEREAAAGPRQPGVPPVCPHAGTPSPPHPQLSITGWPFLLAASSTHLLSFTHQLTVWLRLCVLQLMLNTFDLTISLLPLWPSFFFLPPSCPSLSSSHSPSPCLCFFSPLFFSLVSPVEAGVLPSNSFLPTLAARPLDLLDGLAD